MKCKHCGKDIPSYKTTCPYCHKSKYAAKSSSYSSYSKDDDNRTFGNSYSGSSYSDSSYSGGDSFGGGSSDGGGASGDW